VDYPDQKVENLLVKKEMEVIEKKRSVAETEWVREVRI
jgi:hypothetical protein